MEERARRAIAEQRGVHTGVLLPDHRVAANHTRGQYRTCSHHARMHPPCARSVPDIQPPCANTAAIREVSTGHGP
eukprot:2413061-Rhodomonas_salina.1